MCFKRSRRACRCNRVPMRSRARGPSLTGTCVRGDHHTLHAHAARHPQTSNPWHVLRHLHTSGCRRSRRRCVQHARAASPDRLRAGEARPYHHYPRQRRRSDRRRRCRRPSPPRRLEISRRARCGWSAGESRGPRPRCRGWPEAPPGREGRTRRSGADSNS